MINTLILLKKIIDILKDYNIVIEDLIDNDKELEQIQKLDLLKEEDLIINENIYAKEIYESTQYIKKELDNFDFHKNINTIIDGKINSLELSNREEIILDIENLKFNEKHVLIRDIYKDLIKILHSI